MDTPGYFDFVGETYGALRASEGAILVVDASSGIEVGTEKAWKLLEKHRRPRFIFINKMDKENVDFEKLINELRQEFGDKIYPFALPIGKAEDFKGFVNVRDEVAYKYVDGERQEIPLRDNEKQEIEDIRESLMEKVAETDDELMMKYFDGEPFTTEEIAKGLRTSVANGDLVPVFLGSAEKAIGMDYLLSVIQRYIPSPKDVGKVKAYKDGEEIERNIDINEPFSAIVFKTIVDPFVGKLSLFKVLSGKLTKDMDIYNPNKDKVEKLGGLFVLRGGKNQIEVNEIIAGDIGATSKLQYTQTGDSICDKNDHTQYERLSYPQPTLYLAVEPKAKGDEEKNWYFFTKTYRRGSNLCIRKK